MKRSAKPSMREGERAQRSDNEGGAAGSGKTRGVSQGERTAREGLANETSNVISGSTPKPWALFLPKLVSDFKKICSYGPKWSDIGRNATSALLFRLCLVYLDCRDCL